MLPLVAVADATYESTPGAADAGGAAMTARPAAGINPAVTATSAVLSLLLVVGLICKDLQEGEYTQRVLPPRRLFTRRFARLEAAKTGRDQRSENRCA
jgi:hypothetical protein